MAARHFSLQVGVALAALGFLNPAVSHLARNATARVYARTVRAAPPCTDLFVGHSLVAGGVDVGAFDSAIPGVKALNIGMNSTGPVEHSLLLGRMTAPPPARLYYGFLNDQLTHRSDLDPLSDLIGNRGMVYYRDAFDTESGARMYAGDDPFRYWSITTTSLVPMLREQATMWQKVERLRRSLGALGLPEARTNRFGRVDDMNALNPDYDGFDAGLRRAVENHAPLSAPVRRIFDWASRRKTRFFLVLMPVNRAHRATYYGSPDWARYRDYLARLISDSGGILIRAEDWVSDDAFEDAIHLNPAGAKDFSARLARWVAENP